MSTNLGLHRNIILVANYILIWEKTLKFFNTVINISTMFTFQKRQSSPLHSNN